MVLRCKMYNLFYQTLHKNGKNTLTICLICWTNQQKPRKETKKNLKMDCGSVK